MTADSPLPALAPGGKYSNDKIRVVVLLLAFLAVLAYMIEGILVENRFMTDRMRMGMVTANLKAIERAKQEWAVKNRAPSTATPTERDLAPFFERHKYPQAVADEFYNVRTVAEKPAVVLAHTLKQHPAGKEVGLDQFE